MNTTLKCVISGDQKIMWMEYNVDLIKKISNGNQNGWEVDNFDQFPLFKIQCREASQIRFL